MGELGPISSEENVVYINERMRELWRFPKQMSNQEAPKIASTAALDPEAFQIRNEVIDNSDDLVHDEPLHFNLQYGRAGEKSHQTK